MKKLRLNPFYCLPIHAFRNDCHRKSVNLAQLGIGPGELALLGALLARNTTLTALDLSGNPVTRPQEYLDNVPLAVKDFRWNEAQQKAYPPWMVEDIAPEPTSLFHDALEAALSQSKAESILPPPPVSVHGIAVGSDQSGVEAFSRGLALNSTLRFLDLSKCYIDALGASHIANALVENQTLTSIVLDEVPLPVQQVGYQDRFTQLLVGLCVDVTAEGAGSGSETRHPGSP